MDAWSSTAIKGTPGSLRSSASVTGPVPAPSSITASAPTAAFAMAFARVREDGRTAPVDAGLRSRANSNSTGMSACPRKIERFSC